MNIKLCSKCKKKLPLSEFRKDKSKPDGLYSSCNYCFRLKFGKNGYRKPGVWHIGTDGYIHKGNLRQHRWLMEEHISRKLETWEHVHHKNGVKTDNRIENLEILTASEHHHVHPGRQRQGEVKICINCGVEKYYPKAHLKLVSDNQYRCMNCYKTMHIKRA